MALDANIPYPPQAVNAANPVAGRHGAVLGATLIITGVCALIVRIMPQVSFAQAWPLLFFVIGIVQMITPEWTGQWTIARFAEGLGTLLFGAALLACTLGYVGWEMWLTMLSLWPLLLVVAGLHLLSKASGQKWIAAAATLLVWGTLAFSAAGAYTGTYDPSPVPPVFSGRYIEHPGTAAGDLTDTIVDTVTGPASGETY